MDVFKYLKKARQISEEKATKSCSNAGTETWSPQH